MGPVNAAAGARSRKLNVAFNVSGKSARRACASLAPVAAMKASMAAAKSATSAPAERTAAAW